MPVSLTAATPSGLCAFIDASPSPFHVCATVAAELAANGFTPLSEAQPWDDAGGKHYVVRGGSLIAWADFDAAPADPFRVVGAHTDSPNLRVKQHPDLAGAGWQLVGLEPYGGAWLNSWLDRELGVSGRLSVRDGARMRDVLVRIDEPILRVPQLAIHLSEDRRGVTLDPQRHVNAIWGIGDAPGSFLDFVAERAEVDGGDVLGWELMTHDLAHSTLVGRDHDLVSAPRLDNQGTCYAGLQAFLAAVDEPGAAMPVLVMFDHEEVGSQSDRGAQSDLLPAVLERIVLARGGGRADYLAALAGSVVASGDMAHATHPNYPDRHEPAHRIEVGGGPVLKVNQNLRYATDAAGAGAFALACAQAGVPLQRYVHRADLPCGSTIGPMTAARTGISTVDVGAPQLAMHSCRELMGAADVPAYAAALAAFLTPEAVD
ncbi:M18 family aminopeptidase [Nocardia asteroides NBRC 15531]|uniref:M18 family aminopeptidase n=1 Tax=Nocardia asteroides NBRC 15531 TaxID=1110697 RepID=U5E6K5_NOCAS|nr:M18 family aminopeptidase [Nocardia asteroides]TLF65248.1 M18 family aminopeptidase [Nocardia asteroides NBRC 15531]UGT48010.1 M18 family aminopeptidase [Nocardia asteroides]SFM62171.1 aspartyl aminopeptidase [Nocardia asteroides]VEG33050.1 Probable M18 family aminopeptidase 2 [Nocardia asteroides]GAD82830.1 putative M18 family aminopeptidase [Nocardia asteroides NBRC 15531]